MNHKVSLHMLLSGDYSYNATSKLEQQYTMSTDALYTI